MYLPSACVNQVSLLLIVDNRITEEGVKALLSAVGYQTSITQFQSQAKTGNIGLMRLGLNVSGLL